ncbi:hypothetical protein Tco_0405697 [Tanacetum coccineum]
MGNVKKSVAERTRHQRQYDRRVNKRQMQTQESKIDTGKAVDVDLVITESSGTESEVQDDSSRSGNDTDADDADIRPIYDEEPMAEVQLTAECNIFATGQQHTKQPKIINEGRVDQYTEHCQVKSPMLDSSTDNQTTEYSKQSLETDNFLLANNADLKAQIQEKVFAIAALKNDLRKLKGNSVDTKFSKTSVLGKPVLQSLRNQSVVRQPNAFKSERPQMSKPRFASQVDVNNNLSRPITQHYFPKRRESAFAKPDHMMASSSSRNRSKNMPRFSSNDMVHNHYLDEAKKKTQERDRNSKTSVLPSARFQSTADDSKPKPRSTNHSTRSLLVSKSSCVMITVVPIADHSKNSSSFFNQKHCCSTCPWKPTGKIFKTVGLRWVPTGKILASCTSKNDSEPTHGSNVDIPNIHECKQTLDLSAGTSLTGQQKQRIDFSAVQASNLNVKMMFEHISSSLDPQCLMTFEQNGLSLAPQCQQNVPQAAKTVTTSNEMDFLFSPMFDEYLNGENKVVLKSSAVTTADASDKRQQQPDSTSSTSTLAITVIADGNFDVYIDKVTSKGIDQGLGSTSGIRAFALRNFDLEVMEFESAHTQENGTLDTKIQYNDAKTMFAAIETRFGGNKATKKTQKTLLKQQYENFSASSIESFDSIFNRLQKIVSRLAILGVVITQEDLNSNFLGSLPPEWNTHVVVWMNKAEIEKMSIDDLYNNFKIVEQSVKKSVGASSGAQTLAFMTAPSTSSTNDVNTAKPAYEVSTVSPNVNTASPQVSTASFSDNAVYAFLDLEKIHEDDLEAKYEGKEMGHFARECRAPRNKEGQFRKHGNNEDTSSKEMLPIDGVGFDWSDMAKEQNEVLFSEEVAVLKREVACKDYEINVLKSEFEKVKQEKKGIEFKIEKFNNASKSLNKLLGSQITDKSKNGLGYNDVPPPHPLIYN